MRSMASKTNRQRGFHNKKKSVRPSNNRDNKDEGEEPSKTQQRVPVMRRRASQERNPAPSDDDPSSMGKKKSAGLAKEKAAAIPPHVEKVVDEYVASHCDITKIRAQYEELSNLVPDEKQHLKCCQHKDRNRSPEIPCLDETRVVLEPKEDGTEACDFIHANKVSFEERQYIVAQAPINNTLEDFWRMIFQNQVTSAVVLCPFFEQGHESAESFWPINTNEYKYYGKMFINNKKTDQTPSGAIYTIEVLPDGCSNSLITKIYHLITWESEGAIANTRTILRLIRTVRSSESGSILVISSQGAGRACAYILMDIVMIRLFKGVAVKLLDVAVEIRKKRALALNTEIVYVSAAYVILDYIRAKITKHSSAVLGFKAQISNI